MVIDQGARYTSINTMAKYVPAGKIPLDTLLFASAKDGQEAAVHMSFRAALDDYPQYTVRDQTDYKEALKGLNVLDIPWPTITAVFLGSAFVGLFAALIPAFRAGRMNVLNAIATE